METKRKIETIRRGPRMALGKVRKRRLYCLPSVSITVLFFVLVLNFILYLVTFNCVSKKIKR